MASTERARIVNGKRYPVVLCELKVHGLKSPLPSGQMIYQIYHPQMTNYVIRLTKNIDGFYEVSCDWNVVGIFNNRHTGQLAIRTVMKDAMKGKYSSNLLHPSSGDEEIFMFDEDPHSLYLARLSLFEPPSYQIVEKDMEGVDHFAED